SSWTISFALSAPSALGTRSSARCRNRDEYFLAPFPARECREWKSELAPLASKGVSGFFLRCQPPDYRTGRRFLPPHPPGGNGRVPRPSSGFPYRMRVHGPRSLASRRSNSPLL